MVQLSPALPQVLILRGQIVQLLLQFLSPGLYLLPSLCQPWLIFQSQQPYYKTLMLTFKAAKGMAPPYLQKMVNPYTPTRSLRSANTGMLTEPSLKTPGQKSTRPRQFALLAPKLWNKLPVALRTTDSLASFRRGLKTHLFRLHLNP